MPSPDAERDLPFGTNTSLELEGTLSIQAIPVDDPYATRVDDPYATRAEGFEATEADPTRTDDPFATRAGSFAEGLSSSLSRGRFSTGRYQKVREHAAGNLGVVYVARDQELNREVALKEIRDSYADQSYSQAKFLLEAEVTGGLEHPGIVPVYGLGHHDDGRPYYAMRFIRGRSLLDAIKKFHADESLKADSGRRTLALQKLLRRFTDVCNAIAYAHSRGVLHRDLKPDNVMIGRYGETLVVDWGLAKAMGQPDEAFPMAEADDHLPEGSLQPTISGDLAATHHGALLGTPAYMSPEQASGRLDLLGPASDIYGLGATLYHLLVGRPSIAASTLPELLEKIQSGAITRPRSVAHWLDPALEAICLKAMALRPEDRYATPRALAEDLDGWIAGEPVAAYAEPFTRRARRWANKHRTALAIAATALTVAAVLLGGFLWQRAYQRQQTDAAAIVLLSQAEGLAIEARIKGEIPLWDKAIAEASRAEDRLESGGGSKIRRQEVDGRLAVYRLEKDRLQAKLEAEDGDRRMVKTLEDARLRMANGSDGLFDTKAKLDSFQNAFRNHGIDVATLPIEEAARRIRTSPIADEMITALDDWCQSREPGQVPKSRLKEIVIAAETDPLRAAIRDAVSRKDVEALGRFCDREEDRRKFGLRLRIVFDALWRLDPVASIPRLERIRDEFPADYWFNEDLGMIYQRAEPPRLEDAVRCLSIAVALRPESPGGRLNLGGALEAQGKLEQAGEEYRKAIRLEPGFAEPRNNLGNVLRNQGKIDDAIAQYREAIRIKPNLIQPHYNLVNLFQSQGKIDDAIAEFREVLRIKPEDAQAHYALGNLLKTSGQLDPAIAEYRESIRIDHDQIGALCNLGLLLRVKGEFRESLEHLEHGHELGSRQPGWSYPSAAWVAEARRLLSLEGKILAILGGDSPSGDEAERHALMEICYRTDRHATAVRIADQALIDTPSLGDDPTNGLRFNAACSAILAASGRSRNEPAVEDAAKIGFREKALGWLRADLATWARILDEADGPDRGQFVARSLTHWKESGEIAPIRDSASLEKLPETEREAFRGLWREVDELLTRANLSK